MEQMVKIIKANYCDSLEEKVNAYIATLENGWFVRNIQYQTFVDTDDWDVYSALLFLEKWLEEDNDEQKETK